MLECQDGEDHGPQHCATTVAAVQRLFGRRRKYAATLLTVGGWKSGVNVRQAPPMPAVAVYAVVSPPAAAKRVAAAGVVLVVFRPRCASARF